MCDGRPQYYVSTCPDTNRQFLVERGKNCDKTIVELTTENVEVIRRQFLHTETPAGKFRRQSDLMTFLAKAYRRYNAEILPLSPYVINISPYEFDEAKSGFLESLWDVISQHFKDKDEHFVDKI